MKIIVSGVTGFIGKNLVVKLVENGHDVYAIVREHSDTSDIDKNVKIYTHNSDINDMIIFFNRENFDGVIHLASLFLATHNVNDISKLVTSNIQFGTELLEASKSSNVSWFINTGTFWQNFENNDYNPVNLYSATKEAFESIAKYYTQTSKLVFTNIKLNDTFGPNDTRTKVFNLWKKIANTGERLSMSAGEQIIDISYIDDVVNAYNQLISLLEKDTEQYNERTFVVTNNEKVTLKELSKIFEKATGLTLNVDWGDRGYRDREVMIPYSLGETVPGWKQQHTLEVAIQKTVKEL